VRASSNNCAKAAGSIIVILVSPRSDNPTIGKIDAARCHAHHGSANKNQGVIWR